MADRTNLQWDFNELLFQEQGRKILTVSQLTGTIKHLLEGKFGEIWVSGEVSNARHQSSGHVYFTLKDPEAQLNCVLFRGDARTFGELVADGQKILVFGEITVYAPRGQYQLVVRRVEPLGLGALQLAFERLKKKLLAEGCFDAARKLPLPRYPKRLGLVTSPTGAAIRDVIHVIRRRHPALEILLAPTRVQGQGAAEGIAASIRRLNQWAFFGEAPEGRLPPEELKARQPRLDLILVTRGGGSLEDLWAFNEEIVARAILASALPVVSAVGHEIDFTISDFVADVRAATPSAAAEVITEGVMRGRQFLAQAGERLKRAAHDRWESDRQRLDRLARRLNRLHPMRRIQDRFQRLDELWDALLHAARNRFRERQTAGRHLIQRFVLVRPGRALAELGKRQAASRQRLLDLVRRQLKDKHVRCDNTQAKLALLSPLNVLDRGYSITLDAQTQAVIRSAAEVRPGQPLRTRLKSGEVHSRVERAGPLQDKAEGRQSED